MAMRTADRSKSMLGVNDVTNQDEPVLEKYAIASRHPAINPRTDAPAIRAATCVSRPATERVADSVFVVSGSVDTLSAWLGGIGAPS